MQQLRRHKFNIFPEASKEDFERLVSDMRKSGYDESLPITIYQGDILDGWNRYRACVELGIQAATTAFDGTDTDALDYTLRTNKRRNLTSSQWAAVAVEADELIASIRAAVEAERRAKQAATQAATLSDNKLSDRSNEHETKSAHKAAELFNTNRTYINDAAKLKKEDPDTFEKVKDGEVTISQVKKEVKQKALQEAIAEQAKAAPAGQPTIEICDAVEWLKGQDAADLLITDPPYSTDVDGDFYDFTAWLDVALSKVKPTGRAYVFVGAYPRELDAYLKRAMPDQILVWTYRNTLGPTPKHDYKQNWQAILYYKGKDCPELDCPKMTEQFSVQDINAPDGRQGDRYHAWQKPLEIADRFVRHASKPGDVVIDPFACTGTFLIAAANLGRVARGCDISTENLSIAEQRGCQILR